MIASCKKPKIGSILVFVIFKVLAFKIETLYTKYDLHDSKFSDNTNKQKIVKYVLKQFYRFVSEKQTSAQMFIALIFSSLKGMTS